MSAVRYAIDLIGRNKISPAITAAAADVKDLSTLLKEQRSDMRALEATQKKLGKYADLRKGLAATLVDYRKNRKTLKDLTTEQEVAKDKTDELAALKKKLSRRLTTLSKNIADGKGDVKALKLEQEALGDQVIVVTEQLNRSRASLNKLNAAHKEASKKAEDYKHSIDKQRTSLKKLDGELKESGVDTGNLAREQARLKREVESTTSAIEKQKPKLEALSSAQRRMAAADNRLSDAQDNIGGQAAVAATLAAVVPVARSITMDSAMGDVSKVVDFDDAKGEKEAFKSELLKLGVEVNLPAEQLTQIAAAGGQSGIKKEELLGFTEAAAKMSVAFDLSAEDAGNIMTSWRAGMGLNQQQAELLADAVNALSNDSDGTVSAAKISEVLKRNGSDAMASGLTEVQTASLASAMLSGGAEAEVVATGMKNLLGSLTKGWAASGGQKKAMERIGLDPEDIAYRMQDDAVGTIKDVFSVIADADQAEQSALVSSIFGEEGKGMFMSLLKNPQLMEKTFSQTERVTQYEGSYEEEFENAEKKTAFKLGAVTRAFDRLGQEIAGDFLPAINVLAEGTTWVVNALADMAKAGGAVTTVVTGLAAVYVGYKAAMFAWQIASAKVEQWRAQSALDTAEKEARLAVASEDTADKAGLAARALDRFNRVLGRTASIDPGSNDGQRGSDLDRRGRKDASDKKDEPGERPDVRKPRSKRGRLAGLAAKGWAATKTLGNLALEQLAGGLTGPASMSSFASGRGSDHRSTSHSEGRYSSERPQATESHLSSDRASTSYAESRDYSSVETTKTSSESSSRTESDSHTASESEHVGIFSRAVDWLKPLASWGAGAATMLVAPEVVADTLDVAGDLTGTATDMLGALSGSAGDLLGMAGRLIRPVDTVIQSGSFLSAVSSGDEVEAAAAVGDMAGGWGGAAGGAAAGAAIGSIVPILGTGIGAAIGAGLGGWFGGDAGRWAATKVMEWFRSDSEIETNNATNQTLIADQSSSSAAETMQASSVTTTLKAELRDKPLKQQLAEADEETGSVITGSGLQKIHQEIQHANSSKQTRDEKVVNFQPNITINVQPGSNAEQIAELALQKMQELMTTQLLPALNPTLSGRLDDSMEIMS
ncbi:MAG: phage tail tape measure protein [Marinobacterium sp.]|nr:phage tail tape measure protein [Marinobacterium sp.]